MHSFLVGVSVVQMVTVQVIYDFLLCACIGEGLNALLKGVNAG